MSRVSKYPIEVDGQYIINREFNSRKRPPVLFRINDIKNRRVWWWNWYQLRAWFQGGRG